MNLNELENKLSFETDKPWYWKYRSYIFLCVFVACVILIGFGLYKPPVDSQIEFMTSKNEDKNIESSSSVGTQEQKQLHSVKNSSQTNSNKVVVYITGAVNKPGLVNVDANSRIGDVTEIAVLNAQADLKAINLAAKVVDGSHIHIPVIGEVPAASTLGQDSSSVLNSTSQGSSLKNGKVNINSANESELETLPGVGPSTAKSIVSYREKNGFFKSVDDLDEVKGIGPAKLEQIRDNATV